MGQCVLFEFDSLTKFKEYLMFMHRHDVIYELKGVKIINYNVQLEDIHMSDIPINRSAGAMNHGTSGNCIPSADVDYNVKPKFYTLHTGIFHLHLFYLFFYHYGMCLLDL